MGKFVFGGLMHSCFIALNRVLLLPVLEDISDSVAGFVCLSVYLLLFLCPEGCIVACWFRMSVLSLRLHFCFTCSVLGFLTKVCLIKSISWWCREDLWLRD